MSKFLLFFFSISLFAFDPLKYWWINDTIYLKKDYPAIYKIFYNNKVYILKFRWTLFKNRGLVMLYNYENHPFQNILYKNYQLNGYRIYITKNDELNDPYLMLYFKNFKDNVAEFNILIYNPEQNIRIKLNEPRYRKKEWVKKLIPLYQAQFEGEIPYKEVKDE
jgi:hypothetical protein